MDRSQKKKRSEAYIEANLDFHLALAEAVANPLILSLIDFHVGLLRSNASKSLTSKADAAWAGSPQSILEAVERRDPEMARSAMRRISSKCARILSLSGRPQGCGKHARRFRTM